MKTALCLVFSAVLFASVGCISANITEPSACDSDDINFGTIPSEVTQALALAQASGVALPSEAVTLPPQSVTEDFSGALNDITDITPNVQASITQLLVSNNGNLNWVRGVNVQITGSDPTDTTPQAPLATYTSSSVPGGELSVNVVMPGTTLLTYLESGPVTLTFTLNGVVTSKTVPSGQLSSTINVCISASASLSKSI
jgi:hypothetical protein